MSLGQAVMQRKYIALASLVALLVAAFLSLPYISLWQMQKAVKAYDEKALAQHVNFPSVRQSLKNQIQASFEKELGAEAKDNPFAALGMAFGGMVINKMLEAYVTPEGLSQLMLGQDPETPRPAKIYGKTEQQQPLKNAKLEYVSLSEFNVTVSQKQSDESITFILRREGFSWQLSEVLLPIDF